MTDYTYEQILSTDGSHRARVVLDTDSYNMKPDGCYFGTVYRLETGGWSTYARAEILGQDSCVRTDFCDELGSLWELLRDMQDMEAVLRGEKNICDQCDFLIHHEAGYGETWIDPMRNIGCAYADDETDPHTPRYDFSDNPIVGFDYIDRDYGKMVNIVTLRDIQHWGYESLEDLQAKHPGKDPSDGNLGEWEAWANGEVYYVVVEERVGRRTIVTDLRTGEVLEDDTDEDWREIDACHGFYGEDNATERAQEMLDEHVAAKEGN